MVNECHDIIKQKPKTGYKLIHDPGYTFERCCSLALGNYDTYRILQETPPCLSLGRRMQRLTLFHCTNLLQRVWPARDDSHPNNINTNFLHVTLQEKPHMHACMAESGPEEDNNKKMFSPI